MKTKSEQIIGLSRLIEECKRNALKIASSDAPVLITGNSGTGKELFADFIVKNSKRSKKPFVKINCAAIPDALIETELFGHVKGAFTDASSDRKGKFLSAHTGTIFLDEIFELSIETQSRLLRVIEAGYIEPIGSDRPITVDIRIIAATNRNTALEVKKRMFREDLYYRLNVLPLHLPDLKDRREDIPAFINYFVEETGEKITFEDNALEKLIHYRWSGNIRELKNQIYRLSALFSGQKIRSEQINFEKNEKNITLPLKTAINNYKKKYIIEILDLFNWNQSKTAKALNIQRTYLSRLIKELDIENRYREQTFAFLDGTKE